MRRSIHLAAAGALALAAATVVPSAASAAPDTVTISGNAYEFIFSLGSISFNDTLPSRTGDATKGPATITVDQHPEISVQTGTDGAYSITVPNDADITLRATATGYHETYTQTFHTSGADLTQVNFQMPADMIFKAMAGIAHVSLDADGNPTRCAIVSTLYHKEGRNAPDFWTFHEDHPHGIAGASASDAGTVKPTYFNKHVLPDPTQPSSSPDGGVLWTGVPAGRYQLTAATQDDSHRFSTFVADCKDGRFINASPPQGLYELNDGESANPADLAFPAMSSGRIEFPAPAGSGQPDAPAKAATTTRLSAPKSIRAMHKATVRVRVKSTGGAPTGKVAVFDGAKKVASLALKAGKASAKVLLKKVGKHRLRAVYAGSSTAASSTSRAITIRVH